MRFQFVFTSLCGIALSCVTEDEPVTPNQPTIAMLVMKSIAIAFVAIIMFFASQAKAQNRLRSSNDWPTTKAQGHSKDATALEVLKGHRSTPGVAAWKDLEAHGSITFASDPSATPHVMTLEVMGSDHYRLDVEGAPYDSLRIAPHSSQIQMHGKQAQNFQSANIIGGYLTLARIRTDLSARNDISLEDAGTVNADGVQTREIRIQAALLSSFELTSGDPKKPPVPTVVTNVYLSPDFKVLQKVTTSTRSGGRRGPDLLVEDRFDDYRMVDGCLIPYKMTELVGGALIYTLQLSDAKINVGLDETRFRF